MKRCALFILACVCSYAIVIAFTESRVRAAQAAAKRRGVYSEAQRMRGETVYAAACAGCHGATLTGKASLTAGVPPLTGDDFLDEWTGKSVGDLFQAIRTAMPKGRPGTLMPQEYTDVLAYILSRNAFPAGPTDLVGELASLKAIPIDDSQTTPLDIGPPPNRSVLDGVYTEAQSKRGAAVYDVACAACHATTLAGRDVIPPLAGPAFLDHWTGASAADLFTHIQSSMPQDKPGSLTPQEYASVVAHIFSKNRFPPGPVELEGDRSALRMIRIETSKKPG
jgi:cytochrome c